MQNTITEIIQHMSHANEQMARILEAERHVTVRLSEIVLALPDEHPSFGGMSGLLENTQAVGQNIVAYLNSIADFQEIMASQLTFVIRELKEADEEE
ncbi:nucleoside-diphosphate sugar epimerase [Paenibacillus sp. FSL H8-0548]|uniref:nucleoside-diphosphate sugar epimerase n=1 Tax=Paenibacillus sp. FSL H8-0548 TaxID=1920422 RepID=UPI00096CFA23|nr:nucleoside-diphosphate sugar epimerase [Paenibacillus sp. FSL H8-0548]OMF31777.1 nucleoside-diphosphate sugar epimerase [Paenibacillus sp. FSL H8-0548]